MTVSATRSTRERAPDRARSGFAATSGRDAPRGPCTSHERVSRRSREIELVSLIAGLGARLLRSFYGRPTAMVARDLLGKVLVYDHPAGRRVARLVEVEAYLGSADPASHAYRGLTPRTAPMFGPPGRSYVYFVYGMYHCLNVVTERNGVAGAVLLRGAEPLAGLEDLDPRGLAGPGKLARAFGLTTKHTNLDLVGSPLSIREAPAIPASRVVRSVRVGLNEHATTSKPWRLHVRGSTGVSRP